ncbi:MAG TPA: radical SAM family heme chaperone HemW [Bacteroidales bacterium]|jgi:oxygen-independent coproporphyrinogen-3 oxidase|nr:radical SAM family heme chaperone HemW [Bacteroidales bacterium]HPB88964.1 radical SAM family heme chaperone HemW [Bacteroidales bacterium]HPY21930.1 radical SAM family heme chaperone HemW [Bacteroidales bacterium]HQA93299.1 radical SAM family heme chaperone HemW [Bacteroidales bacterium]HQN23873.1 radical SAM family heme chaperone HemW [Bacteroidales bacterium]
MAGIYIHLPFCSSFCLYCDFYSEIDGREQRRRYLNALKSEISERVDYFAGVFPDTIYMGGGTPSLLDIEEIADLADTLRSRFEIKLLREFTLEANPDDVTPQKLEGWRRAGVDRLSIGVQSFCDDHLVWMRRRHTSAQAINAFKMARKAGFDNISLDLIFGFEGLSDEQWSYNIAQLMALSPDHVSCYQMSIEPGSELASLADAGHYHEPSQEVCAAHYSILQQMLKKAGYRQYEISNFAIPGKESIHNSSYWERIPYLGLGASAHSFDGRSCRCRNIAEMKGYIDAMESNDSIKMRNEEFLSEDDKFNEQIMLGLRKMAGLSLSSLESSRLAKIKPVLDYLTSTGDIISEGGIIRIPEEKLFVSDGIMQQLFL